MAEPGAANPGERQLLRPPEIANRRRMGMPKTAERLRRRSDSVGYSEQNRPGVPSGVGPGVRSKGRAGCSSSVMCEVCRFRTLRPIYLAICRIRKSCRGPSHAGRPPRFRQKPVRPCRHDHRLPGHHEQIYSHLSNAEKHDNSKIPEFSKNPILPIWHRQLFPIPSQLCLFA